MTGFDVAPPGPVLIVMGDLSDDLRQVDRMLELYRQGYHLVAGSRYMKGGSLVGGPFFKQALSRMAGTSLYWLRGLPTHDATNAFKIYDRSMVQTFNVESRNGFELNLELTVKAFLGGYRIAEVPSMWRDRTNGQSRFRLWKWLPHYLHWYFYAFRGKTQTALKQE
jgi:dolichol-phosphate mannosyltransferase